MVPYAVQERLLALEREKQREEDRKRRVEERERKRLEEEERRRQKREAVKKKIEGTYMCACVHPTCIWCTVRTPVLACCGDTHLRVIQLTSPRQYLSTVNSR